MTLLKLTFRNFRANKWRFLLTLIAVTLGVTFTVAVFVFTDSLRSTFGDLSQDIQSGFDIAVRSEIDFGDRIEAAPVPLGLDDELAALPGVEAAQPRVAEINVVALTADGEAATASGPPNIGVNWETETDQRVLFLADGRAPIGGGEFAMDTATARADGFVVGQIYDVQTPRGVDPFELVGTFTFAAADESAQVGAKILAFETTTAVDALNNGEGYDDIVLTLEPGADPAAVEAAVSALLPAGLETVTQEVLVEEQAAEFDEIISIFQTFLLVFAFIILLVSAFIIFNTFTILIGQRVREFGLLRALGATGLQITRSMVLEAFIVGVIATVSGIVAGYALAVFLRWLLALLDFGPKGNELPVEMRTLLFGAFVGIGITLAAAVWPALKARKVSPMAALRDDARLHSDDAPHRPRLGAGLMVAGALAIAVGFTSGDWPPLLMLALVGALLVHLGAKRVDNRIGRFTALILGIAFLAVSAVADLGTGRVLVVLGAGAIVTFLGVNAISPFLARPVASTVGRWPTTVIVGLLGVVAAVTTFVLIGAGLTNLPAGLFLLVPAALFGIASWLAVDTVPAGFRVGGRMARENASRSPERTAATAAALMIGLALVTAASVVGSSLKATFSDVLEEAVIADWFISPENNTDPSQAFSTEVADRASGLPEIEQVLSYRFSQEAFRIGGEVFDGQATDLTQVDRHIDLDYVERNDDLIGPNAVLLFDGFATDRGLDVGSMLDVEFADGSSETLTVAALYDDNSILGDRVVDLDLWDRKFTSTSDQFLSAIAADGFDEDEVRQALGTGIGVDFPQLSIQTVEEFRDSVASAVDNLLIVVNVLLGLAIVIALVGVTNTLALSVFERTRELGLMRAVGMTGRQMRRMVRFEGVIVSIFGGLLGVGLGLVLGTIAVEVIPDSFVSRLDVPIGQLAVFVAVAAVAGLFAAALPARRASKLNVLEAINHD